MDITAYKGLATEDAKLPAGLDVEQRRINSVRERYSMFKDMAGVIKPAATERFELDIFTVGASEVGQARMFDPYGEYRDFIPGSYARLRDKMTKDVIMSDTPMERKTNLDLYRNASGRVLIGGLGIGMVLLAIQDKTEVTSITVIEKFKSIIDMVAPMLPLNGKVTIINDNVFTWLPKRGEKFDTIYMDIWNEISGELWAEHKELRKKFRKYLAQGGWLETWRSKDFQRKSYGR